MASSALLISDPPPTLAVVLADSRLRDGFLDQLRSRGLTAWGAEGELDFYRELAVRKADIILLDMALPMGSGLAVLQHLASSSRYGLMALVDEANEAQARSMGAQGCVTKPVNFQHLLYGIAMLWESCCQQGLHGNGWRLDPEGPKLVAPNGRGMSLTTTEQRLMGGLMACYGQTLAKEQLITLLWGKHSERDYHGVEVLLSRLRRKALKELQQPLPVRAVQAVGLLFSGLVTPNVP